jgi:capsular polysaccharide biosynthesis protein
MDVAQILAIGRRRWWLLVIGVMFSVAAYGVFTRLGLRTPPPATYAASTTLFATLPPLPDAALTAVPAKRPWEFDRLIATYGEMVKSRTVAQRAVRDAGLTTDPDDLASRITTDTFGYTQLLRVTVTGPSAGDAERSVAAVLRAFADVRSEQAIPGDAAVFETSPAIRADRPVPESVNLAIVVVAGLLSASGIVLVFEYLSAGARRTEGGEAAAVAAAGPANDREPGAELWPPADNERASRCAYW